ncbi:MAG TPA: HAD family hydrolase [Candidatus Thermoplasmatota archaeon]|nr:HAD family hydrolase [Candidatus Thermoplasmatota archaeon]
MNADLDAIVFDLDDTLVDATAADRAALDDVIATVAPRLHPEAAALLDRDHDEILAEARRVFHAGGAWTGPEARFARLLARHGVEDPALARDLAARYFRVRAETIRPYQGVAAAVEDLAGRYPLAIVSNAPAGLPEDTLARTGLARHFRVVVSAGAAGVRKPDPAIFRLALDRLGVAPARTMMVGDAWTIDLEPALALGMRAVLVADPAVRRSRMFEGDGPVDTTRATARIASVAELPALLRRAP